MKKSSVLLFTILLSVFAFSQNEEAKSKKSQIDIYYFHRTERCKTCLSIEENTKNTLGQYFADELKDGIITFNSINYEGDTEKEIIEKYDADAPALYLTKVKKGKETNKNLTDFAFDNSLHNADKFKKGLRDKINELLR
ncbi:MAG: nitrophenyl compound nitroreductase subunit ArsF family protein [Bacteroidales bacterium]|nr:nitrophenyl compound nitroreductase subunit ArsF family protein [Bacteroidales bacterium]